jgi:hypothetical protein
MPKPLHANQHRAIALLSLGMDMSSVAADCNITRGTLYRWKKMEHFQRSLTRQTGEMMGAVVEQIQNEARVLIAGGLDSANKLRQLVLDEYTPPSVKRLACNDILRYQGRFLDMLGFNAKVAERRKLANEELPDLEDADPGPEYLPPEEPGDIDQKPVSEQAPPNPMFFRHEPPVAEEFRRNPINDDGTPIESGAGDRGSGAGEQHRNPGVPPGPIEAQPQSATDESTPREPASDGQSAIRNPGVPPGVLEPQPKSADTIPNAATPTDPNASEHPTWRPPPHPRNCKKLCCNPPKEEQPTFHDFESDEMNPHTLVEVAPSEPNAGQT